MPALDNAHLQLIVGPYRSGKTGRLLQQMLEHCQKQPFDNSLILVPSARYRRLLEEKLAVLLRRQIGAKTQAGVLGLKVVTFQEICQLIMQAQGRLPRLLPDKLAAAVVARVMDKLSRQQQLPVFAPIAQLSGTHATVLSLIDEFERAGLSPTEVSERLEQTASAESRYFELARIYQGYWNELAGMGYLDSKQLAFACREYLFSPDCRLKYGWLAVDGFDRFSRLQSQIIKGLSLHADATRVLFDYVPEEHLPEYAWKEQSYRELLTELAVEPQLVSRGEIFVAGVEQFNCLDRFAEMQEIARRCKQALLQKEIPAREILVVARDLKSYRGAIAAAFDDAQLPYFVDENIELKTLPVVQFVLRLLRLSIDDFKRLDVVDCLSSRYCRLSYLGLDAAAVNYLDEITWKKSLVSGRGSWQRHLSGNSAANGVNRLFDLLTPPRSSGSLSEYCRWFEDVLDCLLDWKVDKLESAPSDNYDVRLAVIEIRRIMRQLIQEDLILQPGELSFETFSGRFQSLVEKSNYRPAGKGSAVITICGADLAPNCKFKQIFVAGMIEGEFPRRTNLSGFVSADELARWTAYGIPLHNPRLHPGFETALFSFLKERAQDRVTLSYPRYEMNGDELIPSFFLRQENGLLSEPESFQLYDGRQAPLSAREAICAWLWNQATDPVPESYLQNPEIAALWDRMQDSLSMVNARRQNQTGSVYSGYLVDLVQAGALPVPERQSWSASRLNEYGKCPFRYWVSRLLNWQWKEEPQAGLSHKLKGEMYHRCLELFFRGVKEQGLALAEMTELEQSRQLESAFSAAIAWLEEQAEFHAGEFWAFEKRELWFRLQRFLQQELQRLADEGWRFLPQGFEVNFGGDKENSYPALQITAGGKAIQISGQIDRIDVSDDKSLARVIDYKSGSTYISRKESQQGRNLQLPLYALAVQRSIMPDTRVENCTYLSVAAAKAIGNLGKPEGVQEALTGAEAKVRSFVQAIAAGDFSVRPSNKGVCERCDHKTICRISELNGQEVGDEQTD